MTLNITLNQRELLLQLLKQFLPDVGVWAFGSRVKDSARPSSDLDLVVFIEPSQRARVSVLQEALEESNLPFRIDLLIWDEIPESFKSNIVKNYIELVNNPNLNDV